MKNCQRERLAQALLGRGAKARFAAAAGKHPESVRSWLAGQTAPTFEAVAAGCAALGIPLDWIAYGTAAPALDEALLAKALAKAEALAAPGRLSPLHLAQAAHLIYMRALEHPGAPYSRAELLRILKLSV